jgi:hypothetical protein
MIVERFTIPIKPGRMDEALSMLKEEKKNLFASFTIRICSPNISPRDVVVIDLDFADMPEHDKLWGEIFAKKEWGEWQEKWDKIRAGQSANHIWFLD